MVGEHVTRESIGTLRDDIAQRLHDTEVRAEQLPHREKYLLIVTGFLRRLLELIDEVERELQSEATNTPTRAASSLG